MPNLVLDIGNSFIKTAVFNNMDLINSEVFDVLTEEIVENFFSTYQINAAIISSVKKHYSSLESLLADKCFYIKFDHKTPVPVKNLYKTPSTLGMDRLAGVTGAATIFPGKNILVIDAGTCITYDIINEHREYLGGSISPGLSMRFKALNNFTGKLPLLTLTNVDYLWGKTTEESILAGVVNGTISEIDETINQYRQHFTDLQVVFCGGDLVFFDNNLKNRIFASGKLVLYGLNEILNYNVYLQQDK